MATELKVLNLENCALRRTPDLSAFKSLEILILKYCDDLEEIHPSIEDIKTLISLNVEGCSQLKELPLGVAIEELPESIGSMKELKTLDASCCTSLALHTHSIGSLVSLSLVIVWMPLVETNPGLDWKVDIIDRAVFDIYGY
ncbi:hypothetical protein NL676_035504 [Syzygium grande]|nr:hypothetical protein NL676_035504 [Syzygium grande]